MLANARCAYRRRKGGKRSQSDISNCSRLTDVEYSTQTICVFVLSATCGCQEPRASRRERRVPFTLLRAAAWFS